jgi:uncharacterized membrane protein
VSTGTILVVAGAFLASAVEMVEALTIVLGVGVVRGWRSTLIGAAAAGVVLGILARSSANGHRSSWSQGQLCSFSAAVRR